MEGNKMDSSPNYSPGDQSDRSEFARILGARVGVNFGPVFESVSYLMGRYCKSSYSLKRCLEALNSDEKMRKKIAKQIWYHYTRGVLGYDKQGVDLDDYNEYGNAYTSPDEEGTKVATGDEGASVGNDSDTVSNDNDDVETATIKTDGEAAVGLTDDERLMAAAAASFGYDGGDAVHNDDDDDIDAVSDHYVVDVDTDGEDVNDGDDDNTDDDATVQSDDADSDDVDDDDVDNADDDATVQSVDTDGDYVNDDDVDNTDDDANIQSVDSDDDDVNNNNNEEDEEATDQSDDDSTVPSDYDDVVVGSSNGGDNSNRCDSSGSSSPSDGNVYTADSDEIRANSSISNDNFEEQVSPNSYEEDGAVNDDDVDDAFIPSDEVVPPSSCEDNGSDDPPFNNEEVNTSDSDGFVTTSDEDEADHSYITIDPVDSFLGTLQEQCMWLYKRGLGEGDGKFKSDPIRRRARLKKIAEFYFEEKMDDCYPRIKYQKPTYQNGYEFGLTDYLRRLGKRLGVEFGPVFEGCAIKMGRYLRSTRTLQRCVDIINNDDEMRRGLARSVWQHFIEGLIQKIR